MKCRSVLSVKDTETILKGHLLFKFSILIVNSMQNEGRHLVKHPPSSVRTVMK